MPSVAGEDAEGYEGTFRLGDDGVEEFQCVLDRSYSQAIYPSIAKAEDNGIPIRGPNDNGSGKNFLVRGKKKEQVTVRLLMKYGRIVVGISSESLGARIFESADDDFEVFYVSGTFNDWHMSPMTPDNARTGVFKYLTKFGGYHEESFQILVEGDKMRAIHPSEPQAALGESIVEEPDGKGEGLYWCMRGEPYGTYEIVLNFNELDKRKIVTWGPATSPDPM
jgi:hypothetical protein